MKRHYKVTLAIAGCLAALASKANAFEGRIEISTSQDDETTSLLYTVSDSFLRIEVTGNKAPTPIDIVDLKSGALTLVFPHNRSFVRLNPGSIGRWPVASGGSPDAMTKPLGTRGMPPVPTPANGLPPDVGPQSSRILSGEPPALPMPIAPPSMHEKIELKATGQKDKILGFACEQFEIKQRGETMKIWATDKLLPFHPYVQNQRPRFGPRMLEEQWAEAVAAKKMFPLRATLRFDERAEGFRFEVKSIAPGKIDDKGAKLFQPPPDYTEIQPLQF